MCFLHTAQSSAAHSCGGPQVFPHLPYSRVLADPAAPRRISFVTPIIIQLNSLLACLNAVLADPEGAAAGGGRRAPRRIPSNESFSSLSLAIKAMTRFGPSSYGNLKVRLVGC